MGWGQIFAYCGFVEYAAGLSMDFKGLADPKTAKARACSSAGLVRW